MVWLTVALTIAIYGPDSEIFPLEPQKTVKEEDKVRGHAFFLSSKHRVLQSLPIQADSIRVLPKSKSSYDELRNKGWVWQQHNSAVRDAVVELKDACFSSLDSSDYDPTKERLSGSECLKSHFLVKSQTAAAMVNELEMFLKQPAHGLSATCSTDPAKWALFCREGNNPQNMHYDTVASERGNCSEFTPEAESGYLNIRAWIPIVPVQKAPLLISNTTYLYKNACAKRAASEPGKSASWKIFSREEFLADCAQQGDGCQFFHTVGMIPGEVLFFRNGMVLHGTAKLGEGMRVAMAVDCVVRKPGCGVNYDIPKACDQRTSNPVVE